MAAEGGGGDAGGAPLVLVTGASGFVAGNIVYQLLAAGYRVRGTVRDPANEEKTKALRNLPGAKERLELVKGNLLADEGWDEACKDVTFVVHTASPFPLGKVDNPEEQLIKPALDGTTRVLEAAKKAGVKRVVLTSSVVAVDGGHEDTSALTEEMWTIEEKAGDYPRSKTVAEKKAWEVLNGGKGKAEDGSALPELVVINPGFVMGPTASKEFSINFASADFVAKFMNSELPALPRVSFLVSDVGDLARAHIRAMTAEGAAGHRILSCRQESVGMAEIGAALAAAYPDYGVPTSTLPDFVVHLGSWFNSDLAAIAPRVGKPLGHTSTKAKDLLGVEFRPAAESFVGIAGSLVRNGRIPDKTADKSLTPAEDDLSLPEIAHLDDIRI